MLCGLIRCSHIYELCMSPILYGSSSLQFFKHSNAIKIHNGITFDFYTRLSHVSADVIHHKSCSFCPFTDVLTGTSQVDLTCNRNSGNGPWYHTNEADNNNTVNRGTAKYGGSINRLIINNVIGTDEGLYECQVGDTVETAGCVFVLG